MIKDCDSYNNKNISTARNLYLDLYKYIIGLIMEERTLLVDFFTWIVVAVSSANAYEFTGAPTLITCVI